MISKLVYYVSRLLNRRPVSKYRARIDKKAVVGNGAQIVDCAIGRYSYVHNSSVVCTDVGAFCSIAQDCTIGGGAHPTDWVSSSPVFYEGKNVFRKHFARTAFQEYRRTVIGNDVWIGSKCLIKAGVTIGDGAIIGMGSVVTHDVPPYEIWAGNPAKCIRKRFDDEVIRGLLETRWWDFSEEDLTRYAPHFNDPAAFLEAVRADKEKENG